ncbi:hypothetical protein ACKVMT_08930 [Halobacteriales archaeon Cl-PHB]
MKRRTYLASAAALATGTAGCAGIFETKSVRTGTPSVLEDRPADVYVPTHVEGMEMTDMATAGRYKFALSYSFPHRFWLVSGGDTNMVSIQDSDSVHLMLAVWDSETNTVLPSSNTPLEIRKGGDLVASRPMWGMLSQNMGVHFGDNLGLDGDGTYQVSVDFGPLPAAPLGDFAGSLGDRVSVDMTMAFSQSKLDGVRYEDLGYRAGRRDALDPMDMGMVPTGQLPKPEALPGDLLGQDTTGGAVVAVTVLESAPEGVESSGPYLAVSPRTPYNRYPLPRMSLSATVDGTETGLSKAIHPDLGYHYGAVVEGAAEATEVTVTVDSIPTVARHEGYEEAFVDMPPVTVSR